MQAAHVLPRLYWARFAATGDQNGGDAPVWPRYDASSDRFLAIDLVTTVGERLRAAEFSARGP